jgi:hypothetical protein
MKSGILGPETPQPALAAKPARASAAPHFWLTAGEKSGMLGLQDHAEKHEAGGDAALEGRSPFAAPAIESPMVF